MMGEGSDEEEKEEGKESSGIKGMSLNNDSGCSWGIGKLSMLSTRRDCNALLRIVYLH